MTALALFAGAPASAESRARSDGRPGGPLPIELLGMPSTARRPTALLDQHRLTLLVHENTRLQRAEIRARHRLEALHTLSTTLTRSLDLATVLDLIAGNLDTFIGTGRGHVWLWDEQRRLLVGHDASSAEPALRPGEDVEGVVVASRRDSRPTRPPLQTRDWSNLPVKPWSRSHAGSNSIVSVSSPSS
jgi:hypothetical protein